MKSEDILTSSYTSEIEANLLNIIDTDDLTTMKKNNNKNTSNLVDIDSDHGGQSVGVARADGNIYDNNAELIDVLMQPPPPTTLSSSSSHSIPNVQTTYQSSDQSNKTTFDPFDFISPPNVQVRITIFFFFF